MTFFLNFCELVHSRISSVLTAPETSWSSRPSELAENEGEILFASRISEVLLCLELGLGERLPNEVASSRSRAEARGGRSCYGIRSS